MQHMVTCNFKEPINETPIVGTHFIDMRHYIFSRDNTMDLTGYMNYLNLIKRIAMASKKAGLLELGFMPLIMEPSFYEGRMHNLIMPKLQGLPYFPRQAMTFLDMHYTSDYPDIWVSKMDVAEFLNIKPHEASVKRLLEAIL